MSILSRETLRAWAPVLVLLAVCLAFALVNPNFLSLRNFGRVGVLAAPALMVAIGVTFVIVMGSIDLSMEGVVTFCAVVFATLFASLGGSVATGWVAFPVAILTGLAAGILTGIAHVKLKIPSFMASLAMGFVGAGATVILSGGYRIRVEDPIFRSLLTTRILDMPLMVYVALLFTAAAWFIERHTVIGRNIFAVGGGEDLARASGLRVERVRITAFAIAGVFYALGALLLVARVGIADGQTGSNIMFTSITAVVVGGTSLIGGSGGVLNTLVGVLIVAAISNGMVVIGLPSFVQSGILGLMVIVAVALSINRKAILMVK
ncbi:MAG: ABC transporter permease [Mesorhizobium amorphae]|nr:MAG: ABC transporter permease [Mesorhizobium amorphae]